MEKAYCEKLNVEICLALGFFDCVHLGHRKVIEVCKNEAKKLGVKPAVFTFNNDLNKKGSKQIYTFDERVKILSEMGIDDIVSYPFNEDTKKTSAQDFIENLLDKFRISCFVCGNDYRFGKDALGDINLLRDISSKRGVSVIVVDEELDENGERISSTKIKNLLQIGEIEKANMLLNRPYSITGKVVTGRGEGHIFGIPTANVAVTNDKFILKTGVYASIAVIDGKEYKSVTNIGEKPTFNDYTFTVEALVGSGFNGNLYGKEIELRFYRFVRETKKFESPTMLAKTVLRDLKEWEEEIC